MEGAGDEAALSPDVLMGSRSCDGGAVVEGPAAAAHPAPVSLVRAPSLGRPPRVFVVNADCLVTAFALQDVGLQ